MNEITTHPLRQTGQIILEEHPPTVYLAGLSKGSRPTMVAALNTAAQIILSDPGASAVDLDWSKVQFAHVAALKSDLDERYDYKTANKILSATRRGVETAFDLGQIDGDQYMRVKRIKNIKGESLPAGRYVSLGEIGSVLATCGQDAMGIRDAAIISVWYTTGVRRAELAAANLENYTDSDGSGELVVLGKGNKKREMPVENGAYNALRDWIAIRGDEDGPLFHSLGNRSRGGRMTAQALFYVLKKRAKMGGVADVAPHDMRRSFLSNLLDAGADLSIAQQLAGHASPTTTARYDRRPKRARQKAVQMLTVPYTHRTLPQVDEEE